MGETGHRPGATPGVLSLPGFKPVPTLPGFVAVDHGILLKHKTNKLYKNYTNDILHDIIQSH